MRSIWLALDCTDRPRIISKSEGIQVETCDPLAHVQRCGLAALSRVRGKGEQVFALCGKLHVENSSQNRLRRILRRWPPRPPGREQKEMIPRPRPPGRAHSGPRRAAQHSPGPPTPAALPAPPRAARTSQPPAPPGGLAPGLRCATPPGCLRTARPGGLGLGPVWLGAAPALGAWVAAPARLAADLGGGCPGWRPGLS